MRGKWRGRIGVSWKRNRNPKEMKKKNLIFWTPSRKKRDVVVAWSGAWWFGKRFSFLTQHIWGLFDSSYFFKWTVNFWRDSQHFSPSGRLDFKKLMKWRKTQMFLWRQHIHTGIELGYGGISRIGAVIQYLRWYRQVPTAHDDYYGLITGLISARFRMLRFQVDFQIKSSVLSYIAFRAKCTLMENLVFSKYLLWNSRKLHYLQQQEVNEFFVANANLVRPTFPFLFQIRQ